MNHLTSKPGSPLSRQIRFSGTIKVDEGSLAKSGVAPDVVAGIKSRVEKLNQDTLDLDGTPNEVTGDVRGTLKHRPVGAPAREAAKHNQQCIEMTVRQGPREAVGSDQPPGDYYLCLANPTLGNKVFGTDLTWIGFRNMKPQYLNALFTQQKHPALQRLEDLYLQIVGKPYTD